MTYAILQKDLNIPPVEQLKQAFRSVPFLTDLDAHTLARDAYGILVKRLTPENASALHAALARHGIDTEIVADRQLPPLPPTKFVRRLECQSEGLTVFDPLGRSFRLDWSLLLLIAAGNVRRTEFRRVQKAREILHYDGYGGAYTETVVDVHNREERNFHLSLELVLTRAVQRFSITGDRFDYRYLGERQSRKVNENFESLIQDLTRFAPQAAVNRGAFYLREDAAETFSYPSKNAFFEEITWLLWHLNRTRGG